MSSQSLFLGGNKKNTNNLSTTEFADRVVTVKKENQAIHQS